MRWFKVAAIAAGVLIAFLVVSSVIGFLMEAAIAALVIAVVALAVKAAFYRRQVSAKTADSEIREPTYSSPLPGHSARHVDDELARLKREMGS
jgi:membrane protein implicated in regulation of membrane protease activity